MPIVEWRRHNPSMFNTLTKLGHKVSCCDEVLLSDASWWYLHVVLEGQHYVALTPKTGDDNVDAVAFTHRAIAFVTRER